VPAVKPRSGKELAGIREAARIGRLVLDAAAAAVAPGITTDEIDRIVRTMRQGGARQGWC
jgi:methionyl aminopeptidase